MSKPSNKPTMTPLKATGHKPLRIGSARNKAHRFIDRAESASLGLIASLSLQDQDLASQPRRFRIGSQHWGYKNLYAHLPQRSGTGGAIEAGLSTNWGRRFRVSLE